MFLYNNIELKSTAKQQKLPGLLQHLCRVGILQLSIMSTEFQLQRKQLLLLSSKGSSTVHHCHQLIYGTYFQLVLRILGVFTRNAYKAYGHLLNTYTSSHISETDQRYASLSVARFSFILLNNPFSNPTRGKTTEINHF